MTRTDGTVFEERRYEPFGATVDAFSVVGNTNPQIGSVDFKKEGHNVLNKVSDPDTGWSYHGARWMAPETGRWLSADPPLKTPNQRVLSQPWALHPFQYVDQNPVLYWDPDGEQGKSVNKKPIRALVVYGANQPKSYKLGKYRRNARKWKAFEKAVGAAFAPELGKDAKVTVVRIASVRDLNRALANSAYDKVVYMGHSIENESALKPTKSRRITPKQFARALNRAQSKPSEVYLYGCNTEANGFARNLAKASRKTKVFGFDVPLYGHYQKNGRRRRILFEDRDRMIRYEHKRGKLHRNGEKAHELGQPIRLR